MPLSSSSFTGCLGSVANRLYVCNTNGRSVSGSSSLSALPQRPISSAGWVGGVRSHSCSYFSGVVWDSGMKYDWRKEEEEENPAG